MTKKKQNNPLFGFVEKAAVSRVEEAKNLLIESGYSVSDPLAEDDLNNNLPALVSFFYKKMAEKHKNRKMNYHYTEKDRLCASVLVSSRKKAGAPTKRAYQEARALIEALFEYEDLIGLTSDIKSMSVLGIDWIIKKVVEIANKENEIQGERNFSVYENLFQSYIDSEEFKSDKEKELDYLYRKVVVDGPEEEK